VKQNTRWVYIAFFIFQFLFSPAYPLKTEIK
jgi:hypothetical protein